MRVCIALASLALVCQGSRPALYPPLRNLLGYKRGKSSKKAKRRKKYKRRYSSENDELEDEIERLEDENSALAEQNDALKFNWNSDAEWNYENPENWGEDFVDCSGVFQSPIDLRMNETEDFNSIAEELLWDDDPLPGGPLACITDQWEMSLGHSLKLTTRSPNKMDCVVPSGPFALNGPINFVFLQMHFHWGLTDDKGSEHALEGRHYPLEMHMVFGRQDQVDNPNLPFLVNSLGIFATFFEIDEEAEEDQLFEEILNAAEGMQENHQDSMEFPVNYSPWDLASHNHQDFFAYAGSLTTPPCTQSQSFIVMKEPRSISRRQIERFRALKDPHHEGHLIAPNYRNLQSHGYRTVGKVGQ